MPGGRRHRRVLPQAPAAPGCLQCCYRSPPFVIIGFPHHNYCYLYNRGECFQCCQQSGKCPTPLEPSISVISLLESGLKVWWPRARLGRSKNGSLLSWWHGSFIWQISMPWDCRGRTSHYLFLLVLDHCSGSTDHASITPCKGDIPCPICWVTGCSRHSWHWIMRHHLVTCPWEESSNGHILCIFSFLSDLLAWKSGGDGMFRENEGRDWYPGDTGFVPAWSFTFVPVSNTGMKTRGLSWIWATKCWCLWLTSLHLNRKKNQSISLKMQNHIYKCSK